MILYCANISSASESVRYSYPLCSVTLIESHYCRESTDHLSFLLFWHFFPKKDNFGVISTYASPWISSWSLDGWANLLEVRYHKGYCIKLPSKQNEASWHDGGICLFVLVLTA